MLNELQEMVLLSWIRTVTSFGLLSLSCTAGLKSSTRKTISTSLTLTLSTRIHWSKRHVWDFIWNNAEGKSGNNTALEYFYCYVGINVVTKKKSALALIQWQAIQGSFQQHWTFHCFLYPNLCPNGIKVHPFFLFKLGYKVKLMQQRHSQYHELFFHLSSNVPLKQAQTFPGYPSNA